MSDSRSAPPFVSDQRGVSAVLGFILIFGILILALTTYQAQIVPQENAATEFEHFQDVRDEMVGIRNSISTAGQTDVSQFSDLTLGTNYETRTFTINPPPPSGTLQTSDEAYNITITNETDSTNVSTRFLEYQPGYFETDIGSIWYEHSVLYLDERDRGNGVSLIEDQNILNDGTVRITALQNRFRQSGTKQIAFELYPQEGLSNGDGSFPTGSNLTVTIPTRLDNETYWDNELGGKDGFQGVEMNASGEGIHELNLSVDSEDLEVNTVGVRSDPDESPAKNIDPITGETLNDPDPEPPDTVDDFDTGADEYSDGEDVDVSGNVDIREKDNVGDINAGGYVSLEEKAKSGDIDTDGDVTVGEKGKTGDIDTDGDVTVGGKGKTGDIDTDGDVTVGEKATTGDITAGGDVIVGEDANTGDIDAEGEITYE